MVEQKNGIAIPKFQKVLEFDEDTLKTLEEAKAQKWYEIFIPSNRSTDLKVTKNGVVVRIAATPSINGLQWIIPADQKVLVPQMFYELVKNAPHQRRLVPAPEPGRMLDAYKTYAQVASFH